MDSKKDEFEKLVLMFDKFNHLTSHFQIEMADALLENPPNKKDLEKYAKASEEVMQQRIDKAVYAFVGAMPLASINGINLFMNALALHSNLTGNTTMHDVIEKLNHINLTAEEN
jgi:wyosine [tRNA(Phe)-imidazoG37] synthetase (radical SAM superfamily)